MEGVTGAESKIERIPLHMWVFLTIAGITGTLNAFGYSNGAWTVVRLILAVPMFVLGVTGLILRRRSNTAAKRQRA